MVGLTEEKLHVLSIVTGGAGFIGSHIVDALLDLGHDVIVIDNMSTGRRENLAHLSVFVKTGRVRVVEHDIAVCGGAPEGWQVLFQGADWVFHMAALADIVPSIQNPRDYFRANVDGTFNVLEAARAGGVKRFVYAASSSCYGIPDIYPTPENTAKAPQYPYAVTKMIGEELVMHWAQVYGVAALSLRMFNVYGPRSRTSGTYGAVFGVFLAQKLAKKPYTVVGDGNQTRDFTFVSDVVDAFVQAAQSDLSGEIMNVGSGHTYSINRVVERLGGPVSYIPKRPGEPDCTFADISRITSRLNWQPTVSLEDGIQVLLDNIDYWAEAPVWTPDTIEDATADWFKYLGTPDLTEDET